MTRDEIIKEFEKLHPPRNDLSEKEVLQHGALVVTAVNFAEHILSVAESKRWRPMSELPARQECVSYSQVWCFVIHKGELKILAFNHEHMCWDREDGDDFYCGIHEVTHWMPLPSAPEESK